MLNSGEAFPELPITTQGVRIWFCKRLYRHTNDDVTVARLDIGDLNAHTTVREEESICEGIICLQWSDNRPDETQNSI